MRMQKIVDLAKLNNSYSGSVIFADSIRNESRKAIIIKCCENAVRITFHECDYKSLNALGESESLRIIAINAFSCLYASFGQQFDWAVNVGDKYAKASEEMNGSTELLYMSFYDLHFNVIAIKRCS